MTDEKADGFGDDKESKITNVNCLAGKRCPKCGSYGPLEVQVSMRVLLYDEGTDDADDGSIEYDDDAAAMCYACRYEGKFDDFHAL
jgi:hypothetical protein